MIEAQLHTTTSLVLDAKITHWMRTSLRRYGIIAILFGFSAPYLGWSQKPGFSLEVFAFSACGLVGLSLLFVVALSLGQARSLKAKNLDRLKIQLSEDGLTLVSARGLEARPWSWIVDVRPNDSGVRLRGRDGFFRHIYWQVDESQIPVETYVKMLALFERHT